MYAKYAKLRDEKGVTDYRVSVETGIPASTLSEWKQGMYEPKVSKLVKLSEYFNVPFDYWIGGDN